jgi:hypothetical protein
MKKEIEVWVSDSGLKILQTEGMNGPSACLEFRLDELGRFKHKIEVSVPVPEKRIEIGESEFWKALDECKKESGAGIIVTPIQLKEKLFGN